MTITINNLREMCSPDVVALNDGLFGEGKKENPRRNKYNARKVEVDGMVFDSKSEYKRWLELSNMQKAEMISDLQRQVKFILQESFVDGSGKKQREISYKADYTYIEDGILHIEDRKSVATKNGEAFRVRWRLLLDKYKDNPDVVCLTTGN